MRAEELKHKTGIVLTDLQSLFLEYPQQKKVTYFKHLFTGLITLAMLLAGALLAGVHAIFPFWGLSALVNLLEVSIRTLKGK